MCKDPGARMYLVCLAKATGLGAYRGKNKLRRVRR